MPLSAEEYEVLNYVEQTYYLNGMVPSAAAIAEQLGLSSSVVSKFYNSEKFKSAIGARGIRLEGVSGSSSKGVLTTEQLICVQTLLDTSDTRSERKKLADLGISSQTYQGWLRDPGFAEYRRQRAENLLSEVLPDAHQALGDNVRRGDLGSIKLVYEMTGRWSSKTVGELNVEFLLMKIIEAVQKHVRDPEIVASIAEELSGFGTQAALTTGPSVNSLPDAGFSL